MRAPTSIPPGVLLYQLLTGERPFDGGLTAIMHKVLNTEPPPPSQLAVTAPLGARRGGAPGDGQAARTTATPPPPPSPRRSAPRWTRRPAAAPGTPRRR